MLFHYSSVSQLAKLTDIFGIPETQLKFIIEAWSQVCYRSFYITVFNEFCTLQYFLIWSFHYYIVWQIIECRRVLKWTYAYGYYLDDKVKSEFFEYLQGYYFYWMPTLLLRFIITCGNFRNNNEYYFFLQVKLSLVWNVCINVPRKICKHFCLLRNLIATKLWHHRWRNLVISAWSLLGSQGNTFAIL